MNKEFVLYEEALALKELGFDEPCFGYYLEDGMFIDTKIRKQMGNAISAPIYQQAFDWFRTEHKMKFHIHEDQWNHWCTPEILIPETGDYEEICDSYETFREAELACLKKLIQIVNQPKDE
jgi:hypothetical protein